jgi:hypothetical protein
VKLRIKIPWRKIAAKVVPWLFEKIAEQSLETVKKRKEKAADVRPN